MKRSIRPLLALAAAAVAALAMTFPSTSSSVQEVDVAPTKGLSGAADLGGALRVAAIPERAAIVPIVRADRVWSKASNRASRLLQAVGDVSSAPSVGAAVLAGLLLFGFGSRVGRRLAVVASDPRAPPLHLQLR